MLTVCVDESAGSSNGLDQLMINYVDEVVESIFKRTSTEPHVLALRDDGLQEIST